MFSGPVSGIIYFAEYKIYVETCQFPAAETGTVDKNSSGRYERENET